MDHGVDLVISKDLGEQGAVLQISFNKESVRHRTTVSFTQIIVGHHFVTIFPQALHHVRTDVTGSAAH